MATYNQTGSGGINCSGNLSFNLKYTNIARGGVLVVGFSSSNSTVDIFNYTSLNQHIKFKKLRLSNSRLIDLINGDKLY